MSKDHSKDRDDQLQRYFDEALPPSERAALEATFTEEDYERLAALSEIRGLVKNTLLGEAAEVDLWPGIEGQLPGGQVVSLHRRAHVQSPTTGARRSPFARWRAASGAAGFILAAAAALVLVIHPWTGGPTNNCDIESLEAEGSLATVLTVEDPHHRGGETTIVFTSEED